MPVGRAVSLPRRAVPVPCRWQRQEGMGWPESGVPGREHGRACWKRGVPGVPSSGSPRGQGAAAPPGCRLHLVALGDQSAAGVGTQGAPPRSGQLRYKPCCSQRILGKRFGFPREEGCPESCGAGSKGGKVVFFLQNESFHKARERWGPGRRLGPLGLVWGATARPRAGGSAGAAAAGLGKVKFYFCRGKS